MSSPGQRPPGAFPTAEDEVEDLELYLHAIRALDGDEPGEGNEDEDEEDEEEDEDPDYEDEDEDEYEDEDNDEEAEEADDGKRQTLVTIVYHISY
jgi:hypothetical protein